MIEIKNISNTKINGQNYGIYFELCDSGDDDDGWSMSLAPQVENNA